MQLSEQLAPGTIPLTKRVHRQPHNGLLVLRLELVPWHVVPLQLDAFRGAFRRSSVHAAHAVLATDGVVNDRLLTLGEGARIDL